MSTVKKNPVFKIISVLLIISFISSDIAWSDPKTFSQGRSLAAAGILHRGGTGLQRVNFVGSVGSIGRYLLGDPETGDRKSVV